MMHGSLGEIYIKLCNEPRRWKILDDLTGTLNLSELYGLCDELMVALGCRIGFEAFIYLGERVMAEVQELVRNDSAVTLAEPGPAVAESRTQFVTPFPHSANVVINRQQSLSWTAPSPVAGCIAVKAADALSQLWVEHRGAIADVPSVDFEQSMVVAVFAGEGFFREVPSIERVKVLADEVVVYVSRFSRPWSKHNAKAVIQVPQTALPVRFVYLS